MYCFTSLVFVSIFNKPELSDPAHTNPFSSSQNILQISLSLVYVSKTLKSLDSLFKPNSVPIHIFPLISSSIEYIQLLKIPSFSSNITSNLSSLALYMFNPSYVPTKILLSFVTIISVVLSSFIFPLISVQFDIFSVFLFILFTPLTVFTQMLPYLSSVISVIPL